MTDRSQGWIATRNLAMTVACPACGAEAGKPCVGVQGQLLKVFPAHGHRIHIAEMEKS